MIIKRAESLIAFGPGLDLMYRIVVSLFLAFRTRGDSRCPFSAQTRFLKDSGLCIEFAKYSSATALIRSIFSHKDCIQDLETKLCVFLLLAMSNFQLLAHPEFDGQINALTTQLEKQPGNAELYLTRADVRRQHAEFDLALTDISTAARLKPGWPKLSLVRAKTLFDANRIQEAELAVEQFLKAEPNHAPALLLRGRCN